MFSKYVLSIIIKKLLRYKNSIRLSNRSLLKVLISFRFLDQIIEKAFFEAFYYHDILYFFEKNLEFFL